MLLKLPSSLHYPITIRKIEKQVRDEVRVHDTLFTYTYVAKVKQQTDRYTEEEVEVDKVFSAHFQSTLEGTITKWLVWEDDVLKSHRDILDIDEPCTHSVQFNGMCVECGKDMTGVEMAGDAGAGRATIQGAHDTAKLLISQDEAREVDDSSKRRLLDARKLSLVVDLDQTIIHAAVDPTIGEWQNDPKNPNYEAVKDVRSFQLVDDVPGRPACWYYIKLRPGLEQFLENVAEKYELHIYTMGTRQYAEQIANIVDPKRKYFDDRILSRDESGSLLQKNLTRLFPVSTSMVVIIDDRGDVWKWSPNLIRVSAFDFFVGIGDINAGFLAKKQDIQTTNKIEHPKESTALETNGNGAMQPENSEQKVNGESPEEKPAEIDTTALQQVVNMGKTENPTMQEQQVKTQEEAITAQLEEKPLLKLQQRMDEKDGVDSSAPPDPTSTQNTDSDSSDSETSSNSAKGKRHSVLRNDDEELVHLERSLRAVHERFFNEYDRKRSPSGKIGRVAALAGKHKAPLPGEKASQLELSHVPDVKRIMPAMKSRIFGGVVIVFSGVLPLNTDVQNADISIWAKSFGATIADKVNKDTTHVIAARVGTAKVKTAVKRGIKVVSTDWLMGSIQAWKRLPEKDYLLKGIGQKAKDNAAKSDHAPEPDLFEDTRMAAVGDVMLSSEEGTTDEEKEEAYRNRPSSEDLQGFPPKGPSDDQPRKKRPKLDLDLEDIPPANPNALPPAEMPPDSPVDLNPDEWAEMDDELKDFLGSDIDSESDVESVRSDRSSLVSRTKKRSRDDYDESEKESDNSSDERNGEHGSKRQKGSRNSALKNVANAVSSGENTPVPRIERVQTQEEYDDLLAEELERQMEAQAEALEE